MDECQGNTANDVSGNGNHATVSIGTGGTTTSTGTCSSGTGSESWNNGTTGKRNASLNFDGTDDFIYLSNPSTALKPATLSISTWVNPYSITHTGTFRGYLVAEQPRGAWSDGRGYVLLIDTNGKVVFQIGNAGGSWITATGTTTLNINNWYHLVGTYDGTQMKIFVNGKQDNLPTYTTDTISYTDDGTAGPIPQTFYIGTQHDADNTSNTTTSDMYFANGLIDEVKIFNYPLTAKQIELDYNSGAVNFGY